MGCACPKKILKEEVLNVSQENKNNINSKELLKGQIFENKEKELKEEKEKILTETNNEDLIEESKKEEKLKTEEVPMKNKYIKRIFELINKIRLNPPEYSKIVLDNMKNISIENYKELNINNGLEELKQSIIFKKKIKIKLFRGEESFIEAANILKHTAPMDMLKFNKNIVIPLPDSEGEIKDTIKNKIKEIMVNSSINTCFKEYIKNPEIAVLLMIVDDTEFPNSKKRNALLNKDFKNIGIDSKFFGNKFIAIFSFSK